MDTLKSVNLLLKTFRALDSLAINGDMLVVAFSFLGKNRSWYFLRQSKRWVWSRVAHKENFLLYIGRDLVRNQRGLTQDKSILFVSDEILISTTKDSLGYSSALDKIIQKKLLNLAREEGFNFLDGISSLELPDTGAVSLCVALWVNGQIRGSMMATASSLEEAVRLGVFRALQDRRWKPLSKDEWSSTQIEITLYSPLRMSISLESFGSIDYSKGYIATSGRRLGLYVPEVFNTMWFRQKKDFLESLLTQKGGFNKQESEKAQLVYFNVIDFIESSAGGEPLRLYSSMPSLQEDRDFNLEEVEAVVSRAIGWLQKMQEVDGNILPIARPFSQSFAQVDWDRLNFVIFALAEWNKIHPEAGLNSLINRALNFSEFFLERRKSINNSDNESLYGLVYLAHAYISLGRDTEAAELTSNLLASVMEIDFQPILALETITLMQRLGNGEDVIELEKKCKNQFWLQKDLPDTDIASWAEAVVAFEYTDKDFASEVAEWILRHQETDGSFRQSMSNNFQYTRGTAKLFEVLAVNPIKYSKELARTHAWLASMQYNEINTYFVNLSFRQYLYGGMRHDYNNPDAWIDSVGHYILGASRLYGSKRS